MSAAQEVSDPTCVCPVITLSPWDYNAVLFDLDGVLTRTASVHAAAWKKLFDEFLEQRSAERGEPFVPFDIDADYRRYVDGKPRYDGVASFLKSRGIELPMGAPEDDSDAQTVRALGNRKDAYFLEHLKQESVESYEAAITLVRTLRAQQIKTAVVSSSNNCAAVLDAAGIAQLFDARVDGVEITRLALRGKPAPDAFLEAARRLGVEPSRAVVVEDAIAGVEAGRAGGVESVIGVDRLGQSQALRQAGADVVVTDLAQIRVATEPPSAWSLVFEGFDPAGEGIREALCTLGNGYFATRAAASWAVSDGVHYPGTYLAGGYNRLHTDIVGRVVKNEDLVNFPNWLSLDFLIGDQESFDLRRVTLLSYRQELDLRRGMLLRTIRFEDGQGRRSHLQERRLVSMNDMHVGALELALTAENWSEIVTARSAIDGRVVKVTSHLPWRRKIASLNYLLASHVWRQDHNGFTHQDPGFLDVVMNKKAGVVRVYLPPDANCLLSVIDHCLRSRHYVNVVIAGKHPAPQWLTMDAAVKHCTAGIGIWPWVSNDQEGAPDVVMACCGDVPTLETLAAVSIMREHLPELKIRVVNVIDLMKLQPKTEHPHGLTDTEFDDLFTKDKPVIFAFHGYPWLIHRLTYRRTNHHNIHVHGYKEEGTITTPFDMTVRNDLDRFHLVMDTIDRLPQTRDHGVYLKQQLRDKLVEHRQYIEKNGQDLPEIRDWKWGATKPA